jgi:Ethanolamine utilization protein EutJ (predicted chaperonin)
MSKIIGIDLGTTNSLVAVMEGERPVVVPNRFGARTTPSVVRFLPDGHTVVGEAAERARMQDPEHTVSGIKRFIGRYYNEVADLAELVPYRVVPGDDDRAMVHLHGREWSPPEISALILRDLKESAEAFLEDAVSRAVITIPAYFNDAQRRATGDAARLAGLELMRLVPEPTAAAMAYGFADGRDRNLVVLDLGGGTQPEGVAMDARRRVGEQADEDLGRPRAVALAEEPGAVDAVLGSARLHLVLDDGEHDAVGGAIEGAEGVQGLVEIRVAELADALDEEIRRLAFRGDEDGEGGEAGLLGIVVASRRQCGGGRYGETLSRRRGEEGGIDFQQAESQGAEERMLAPALEEAQDHRRQGVLALRRGQRLEAGKNVEDVVAGLRERQAFEGGGHGGLLGGQVAVPAPGPALDGPGRRGAAGGGCAGSSPPRRPDGSADRSARSRS